MSVTRTIRFLVGAALVAAGVPLVSPLARNLVAAASGSSGARDGGTQAGVPPIPPAGGPAVPTGMPVAPVAAAPEAADVVAAPGAWATLDEGMATDSSGGLQLDRSPPPPPAPLPPLPEEMLQASPPFAAAYRSTLRVPPPDLLDAAGPPPAVAWTAPANASPAATWNARGGGRGTPRDVPVSEVTVPATYRVRDGDDLASIAGRFYGHPAAATAIWAANRETIPHPELLPIGVDLRLPPAWSVGTGAHGSNSAIEPAAYSRPAAAPPVNAGAPAPAGGDPWLTPASVRPQAAGLAPPSTAPAPEAASVRVGPGETLASLARRLYGDPAMAGSIFAANRDRLRSPELVVAGMELRLPRPVTAPRP